MILNTSDMQAIREDEMETAKHETVNPTPDEKNGSSQGTIKGASEGGEADAWASDGGQDQAA